MTFDPTAKVEITFLTEMSGKGGASILESSFLRALPTFDRGANLNEVIANTRILTKSKLFRFASMGSQGGIRAALELLEDLKCGRKVSIPRDPSAFLQQVIGQLGYFYKVSTEGGRELCGQEALLDTWSTLREKTDLSLKDVEPLVTYSFLLSPGEQREIHNMTKNIIDGACKGYSPAPPVAKKTKKASAAAASSEDGAEAFFT